MSPGIGVVSLSSSRLRPLPTTSLVRKGMHDQIPTISLRTFSLIKEARPFQFSTSGVSHARLSLFLVTTRQDAFWRQLDCDAEVCAPYDISWEFSGKNPHHAKTIIKKWFWGLINYILKQDCREYSIFFFETLHVCKISKRLELKGSMSAL